MNCCEQAETERPPLAAMRKVRDVIVLGLGNILLSDDGVGVHVARQLAMNPGAPQGLRALDGGTPGFSLKEALAGSDSVLVVDAKLLGAPPGAMRLLHSRELREQVCRGERLSAHEAGLNDFLTMARLEGWKPANLALLGVQPERIDWGETLSETVARSVPSVCRTIIQTALAWQAA
ncbi:hydrogenase maturation protease [uncultured Rhodoblastus sp.]|uniref:hydrogenase maturation protease n=1 Tax=uncultured Rhodoblastus sp. TaxID=543037 RepID=UPI0025ED13C9|nr:hydrogenase maturation protease [uncultured Rhodoblastus sp.]